MQIIKRAISNLNKLFDDIDNLYAALSEISAPPQLIPKQLPVIFRDTVKLFRYQQNITTNFRYRSTHYKTLKPLNNKNMVVCFSGGKDSLATALHYKRAGYNVYLYHLKGINPGYTNEYIAAQDLAKELQLPIIVEQIHISGHHDYTEHPLKNWIIVSSALQWAIRNGITTNIATGNFYTTSLNFSPFAICAGDCIELWRLYHNIIRVILPGFHVYLWSSGIQGTYDELLEFPTLLQKSMSCMTPNRFRGKLQRINYSKYGLPNIPHRCGSCWKCCSEYIILADKDKVPYNERYYNHCLHILRQVSKKEEGINYSTVEDMWQEYIYYDITESKYWKRKYEISV